MTKYIGWTLSLVGLFLVLGAAGASDAGTPLLDVFPKLMLGLVLAVGGGIWNHYEEKREEEREEEDYE